MQSQLWIDYILRRYPVREPPPNEVTDKDALIEEEARHAEGRM